MKFLHSKTGAALAKHVFGEPDDVCDAIFCHTTGKPGRIPLKNSLPGRLYGPPETLTAWRKCCRLVYEDLDKAMIMGLENDHRGAQRKRLRWSIRIPRGPWMI